MTDYEHFIALDTTYAVRDSYNSTEYRNFLIVIPLYAAVPLGIDDYSVTVPGKSFCSLGKNYQWCMAEVDDIVARTDPAVRRSDYECLSADPARIHDPIRYLNDPARLRNDTFARPLNFWSENGRRTGIPANVLIDPLPTFAAWDEKQKKRWDAILRNIDDARPNVPFNIYSRFVQPPAAQISLVFTPADSTPLFNVATLRNVFGRAFADTQLALPRYAYRVTEWAEAQQSGLVLIGGTSPIIKSIVFFSDLFEAHYLGFYYTWMTSAGFEKIWKDIKQTPVLDRQWPDETKANSVDLLLHNNQRGARGSETAVANMSHFKATMAAGRRGDFPGQHVVMGGSATEVRSFSPTRAFLSHSIYRLRRYSGIAAHWPRGVLKMQR